MTSLVIIVHPHNTNASNLYEIHLAELFVIQIPRRLKCVTSEELAILRTLGMTRPPTKAPTAMSHNDIRKRLLNNHEVYRVVVITARHVFYS